VITIVNYDVYQKRGTTEQVTDYTTDVQQTGNRTPKVIDLPEEKSPKNGKKNKDINTCSFSDFWNVYPRKVAKEKAEKAWEKISPSEELVSQILNAMEWQTKQDSWTKDCGKYIPHPTTWLNGKRWQDEPLGVENKSLADEVAELKAQGVI
jgi:hypothetical protein